MSIVQHGSKRSWSSNADDLFLRANEHWDRGKLKSAFRLFLRGAKAGDSGAQVNLCYFYDSALGVKPNRDLALYWYRRAYRQGSAGRRRTSAQSGETKGSWIGLSRGFNER
jgi:TPR repeat protein